MSARLLNEVTHYWFSIFYEVAISQIFPLKSATNVGIKMRLEKKPDNIWKTVLKS